MNRKTALAPVLVVSVLAGLWLFRPSPLEGPAPKTAEPCEEDNTCSAPAAATATAEPSPVAAPDPPTPAATLPATADDGEKLREQADRLIAEGHVKEGIEAMRKATEADPSPRNHGDLGTLLQRLTVFDEAATHLRAAAELDPMNADRWIALANVSYLKVDPGEAWKAERRAREAEPGLVLGRGPDGLRVRKGDTAAGKP